VASLASHLTRWGVGLKLRATCRAGFPGKEFQLYAIFRCH